MPPGGIGLDFSLQSSLSFTFLLGSIFTSLEREEEEEELTTEKNGGGTRESLEVVEDARLDTVVAVEVVTPREEVVAVEATVAGVMVVKVEVTEEAVVVVGN